jgi:hypothetical protein
MRKVMVLSLILFILMFGGAYAANSSTSLEIDKSPPYLMKDIPLISFSGEYYNNVFDLDDYFGDFEGDLLRYNASSNQPIEISITSQGFVSFRNALGLNTTGEVYFTAFDGMYYTDGNNVSLYLGTTCCLRLILTIVSIEVLFIRTIL